MNCYEESGFTHDLYLFGSYYDAPVVLRKETRFDVYSMQYITEEKLYYILRDYLGSIVKVISEEAFKAIGLTEGWTTECKVSLTEYDLWEVEVDVLPKLPVHMVIGMDIISTGNLSLTYDDTGYTFRFEQL